MRIIIDIEGSDVRVKTEPTSELPAEGSRQDTTLVPPPGVLEAAPRLGARSAGMPNGAARSNMGVLWYLDKTGKLAVTRTRVACSVYLFDRPASPRSHSHRDSRHSALYQSALISTAFPRRGVTTQSPTLASIQVS